MKIEKKHLKKEDMSAGAGQVAGIGIENPNIPNQAEPGINKKERKKIIPDRKSTRLNSSHSAKSRMPSSA